MPCFHLILSLFFAIIAAQAELLFSDISYSNAVLALDQSELGKYFDDIFQQPFGTSSDVDIGLLGSSDYGTNNPMLFAADAPNDKCVSSFLSPLAVGKARRRRNNNPECSSDAEFSEGGIPNLSPGEVEGKLALPGEYEQKSCTGGGYLSAIAFLVCSSLNGLDTQPVIYRTFAFTLYHSTRGIFFISFREFRRTCGRCQLYFDRLILWASITTKELFVFRRLMC